ncbi:TetR/AcrR family transcriptional regulator [Caproiciproducens galactitolivorans]|uniref:TetR/AcrR family transcriptional regulator n=1 Tax=Caproiciproducens galactitolivorans TaxID=642589 RepID=A0ABT4BQY5_9FIRM|nr:TetR/AcrR family transcriptional regulator [Caproiciproducens galactitolivorans]MCY1713296.1 TetR/AcrR family transcriptional regulator [Caproiciproducens galactitolivorans]
MKREEKNAQSRQRILEASLREFSAKGYDGASLNTVCTKNDISKGIIYHYFKDKDEIYLFCVQECFEKLTSYITDAIKGMAGSVEQRLRGYFDARLRFFAENPLYLGIFTDAALNPHDSLLGDITEARKAFDELNISVLTGLLESTTLRKGVTVSAVVEDFRMYMDYFNLCFKAALAGAYSPEQALRKHEERCHRQLGILLYGVLGDRDENR